jgi:proprotein convertase subtilisin/kexin type 5
LSSNICKTCQAGCLTCVGPLTCSSCNSGYRLNSSSLCSKCSTSNCILCSLQDICSVCSKNYYLNNSTKTCVLVLNASQYIVKCIQYQGNSTSVISSQLTCMNCDSNFYLNSNTCQFCSLLCQTCSNSFRTSRCSSCSSYGQLVDSQNGFCSPKIYSI